MKTIARLLMVLALASLGIAADKTGPSEEGDILEAVFRYQFSHNASAQQGTAKVYFISVGEKEIDPSDEFLKRFAGNQPPVQKGSASHYVPEKGVLDRNTGAKGLAFRAAIVKWTSDAEVEVHGGYYEGNMSSSGNTYTLKKDGGRWTVTAEELDWVS